MKKFFSKRSKIKIDLDEINLSFDYNMYKSKDPKTEYINFLESILYGTETSIDKMINIISLYKVCKDDHITFSVKGKYVFKTNIDIIIEALNEFMNKNEYVIESLLNMMYSNIDKKDLEKLKISLTNTYTEMRRSRWTLFFT